MTKLRRNAFPGNNMAIFGGLVVFLIAMLGVSVFVGMQAYVQGEIQKAANTAALAGAPVYYSGNPGGRPAPDTGRAIATARRTFNEIVANSGALRGLGTSLMDVTNNAANDSVTVKAMGRFGTPFLAPVGIRHIEVNSQGTARAVKYAAAGSASAVGPISIFPDGNMNSMQQILELAFPLVDNPGTDLYVEQAQQVEYVVEACNATECYNIVPAAQSMGTGNTHASGTGDGTQVISGTAMFDLAKVDVRKATRLRFTHGNDFASSYGGAPPTLSTYPTPLMINAVYIFGFASVCPNENNCPIPAGFMPVEG